MNNKLLVVRRLSSMVGVRRAGRQGPEFTAVLCVVSSRHQKIKIKLI